MRLAALGQRQIVSVSPDATVAAITHRMAERNVGSVLVVADGKPLGIVTDRDLVLRVLSRGTSMATHTAAQVMSSPVFSVAEGTTPEEAVAKMREARIRRLPIVDAAGLVVGIVCLDDLVHHLGSTQAEVADAVARLPRLEVV